MRQDGDPWELFLPQDPLRESNEKKVEEKEEQTASPKATNNNRPHKIARTTSHSSLVEQGMT